jgi:hypothetical protein
MAKIDDEIRKLCEEKGLKIAIWEWPPPWDPSIEGPCSYTGGCAGQVWWPKGQAIRCECIAETKKRRAAARKENVAT